MTQDIRLKGITSNPSDYDSPDGDLSESINLIHEDGALHPISQPSQLFQLPDGSHLWCLHTTNQFSHYIISTTDGSVKWADVVQDGGSPSWSDTGIDIQNITSISCIGNTLSILSESGLHYMLWDASLQSGENYTYLSSSLPDIRIQFGLKGMMFRSLIFSAGEYDMWYNCVNNIDARNDTQVLTSSWVDSATSSILAKVNELINTATVEYGRFSAPFFVRYALRMYDGSLTLQSAPILMVPNSEAPLVALFSGDVVQDTSSAQVFLNACKLDYAVVSSLSGVNTYKDIVKSVDIFVSAPLPIYNQNGKVKSVKRYDTNDAFGIYSLDDESLRDEYTSHGATTEAQYNILSKYGKKRLSHMAYMKTHDYSQNSFFWFTLPSKTDIDIDEQLSSCCNFYKVASIPISDLTQSRTQISIEGSVLSSLVNRETLDDDYDSHEKKMSSAATVYNSRLMLHGITKEAFSGYYNAPFVESAIGGYVFTRDENFKWWLTSISDHTADCLRVESVFTHVKHNGVVSIVKEQVKSVSLPYIHDGEVTPRVDVLDYMMAASYRSDVPYNPFLQVGMIVPYFYHPDAGAFKCDVVLDRTRTSEGVVVHDKFVMTFDLTPHDTMNGSYCLLGFGSRAIPMIDGLHPMPVVSGSSLYNHPNQLYVSDANNPFIFPPTGIVTIGTGSILGVSTAARPLSQGQFGSFPLYAFCTDGVWALAVSSTGSFSAVQPISREVCISSQGILQLDTSVLFATKRGLMHLSGSEVKCISDSLDGAAFDLSSLPGIADAYGHIGITSLSGFAKTPLSEFLDGCRMVYDYMHQHVVIYNNTSVGGTPKYRYALVFSTKSLSFGCMLNDINYGVRSYPDAISVSKSQVVCNWSANASASPLTGLFITRPIKLGGPDVFKTLRTAVLRGVFSNGGCGLAIYGSRDLAHWSLVGSCISHHLSRLGGTPYKYFRIVGITALTEGQSVSGVSAEFDVRDAMQLR